MIQSLVHAMMLIGDAAPLAPSDDVLDLPFSCQDRNSEMFV